jgi:type II secretory pathway pseudopilin PulG
MGATTPVQLPLSTRASARGRAAFCAGFSLVEAIVATGIVALMLVAALNLVAGAARARAADGDHRAALMLAHQLMGEVQQQPYKDESLLGLLFGPEAGETPTPTRADFDDVDDYHNFMEKPPALKAGTPLAGFDGWKRRVKVEWVDPQTLSDSLVDTGLVRLEVRVTDPQGREISVYAYRSAHMTAGAPAAGTNALVWTGIELEADGETTRQATAGVGLVTLPTTP